MGMDLLQAAMNHHLGYAGVVFIAVVLFPVQLFHFPWHSLLCPRILRFR